MQQKTTERPGKIKFSHSSSRFLIPQYAFGTRRPQGARQRGQPLWDLPEAMGNPSPETPEVVGSPVGSTNSCHLQVMLVRKNLYGAPGGSRTHDLRLRRPTLYPTELRAHIKFGSSECGVWSEKKCELFLFPTPCTRGSACNRGCKTQHFAFRTESIGAPGRARTCGIRLRRPTLYPAELRAPF